jgi:hypothetical protein
MKPVCTDCGWEIINPQWWNITKIHGDKYLCDDCDLDRAMKEHPSNSRLKTGVINA